MKKNRYAVPVRQEFAQETKNDNFKFKTNPTNNPGKKKKNKKKKRKPKAAR